MIYRWMGRININFEAMQSTCIIQGKIPVFGGFLHQLNMTMPRLCQLESEVKYKTNS